MYAKQIDPTECKILLTDPPLNPSKNREKMVYHLILILLLILYGCLLLCRIDMLNNDMVDTL